MLVEHPAAPAPTTSRPRTQGILDLRHLQFQRKVLLANSILHPQRGRVSWYWPFGRGGAALKKTEEASPPAKPPTVEELILSAPRSLWRVYPADGISPQKLKRI